MPATVLITPQTGTASGTGKVQLAIMAAPPIFNGFIYSLDKNLA
jgi:hypothetical protein